MLEQPQNYRPESRHQVRVEPLRIFSEMAAQDIGQLMPELDPRFSGNPTTRQWLEGTINSDSHEQIVAYDLRQEVARIVGALTVSEIREPALGSYGYIAGVIVSTQARGLGIGLLMLEQAEVWCRSKNMPHVELITEKHRSSAIHMYEQWGAERVTDGRDVKDGILYTKSFEYVKDV
jgi:ribosomal protein S18 acetylase RimI-like enzyme